MIFWYHTTVCVLDQQNLICDIIHHTAFHVQGFIHSESGTGAISPQQRQIFSISYFASAVGHLYTPELGTLQRSLQAAVADVCEQMDAWMGPKLN